MLPAGEEPALVRLYSNKKEREAFENFAGAPPEPPTRKTKHARERVKSMMQMVFCRAVSIHAEALLGAMSCIDQWFCT